MFYVYLSPNSGEQPDECFSQKEAFDLVRQYQAKGFSEAFYADSSESSDLGREQSDWLEFMLR